MSKEYIEALEIFNYIMTRCKEEDSYVIKFPLGIQKGTTFGEDMEKAYGVIKEAFNRLESIDNANPSEALECSLKLYKMVESAGNGNGFSLNEAWKYHNTIKQALLKAQEPKKYLKWEDLEFGKTTHKLKVKMNGNLYRVEWYIDGMGSKVVCLDKYITNDYLIHSTCIKDYNQQFFNDLRLERVEE